MKRSVRGAIRSALEDFPNQSLREFVLSHAGQVILAVMQVY